MCQSLILERWGERLSACMCVDVVCVCVHACACMCVYVCDCVCVQNE